MFENYLLISKSRRRPWTSIGRHLFFLTIACCRYCQPSRILLDPYSIEYVSFYICSEYFPLFLLHSLNFLFSLSRSLSFHSNSVLFVVSSISSLALNFYPISFPSFDFSSSDASRIIKPVYVFPGKERF